MLKLISQITAALVVAISIIGPAQAMDTLNKGPKVGTTIPHTLDARDQHSKTQSFESLKGQRGLILIFTRSFDW